MTFGYFTDFAASTGNLYFSDCNYHDVGESTANLYRMGKTSPADSQSLVYAESMGD